MIIMEVKEPGRLFLFLVKSFHTDLAAPRPFRGNLKQVDSIKSAQNPIKNLLGLEMCVGYFI